MSSMCSMCCALKTNSWCRASTSGFNIQETSGESLVKDFACQHDSGSSQGQSPSKPLHACSILVWTLVVAYISNQKGDFRVVCVATMPK